MSLNSKEAEKLNSQLNKADFNVGFTKDDGDKNPPPIDDSLRNTINKTKESENNTQQMGTSLSGFFSFMNLVAKILCAQTNGVIEYQSLSQQEIESLGVMASGSPHFQKLAAAENAPTWLVICNMIGMFGKNIKYKKNRKKELEEQKQNKEYKEKMMKIAALKQKELLQKVSKQKEPITTNNNSEEKNSPSIFNASEDYKYEEDLMPNTQYDEVMDPIDKKAKEMLWSESDYDISKLEEKRKKAKTRALQIAHAEKAARSRSVGAVGYAE